MKKVASYILIAFINIYRLLISPLFPSVCRFTPSCSDYGKQAILKHGPLKGLVLTIKRITRCHPWGGSGDDPVPKN